MSTREGTHYLLAGTTLLLATLACSPPAPASPPSPTATPPSQERSPPTEIASRPETPEARSDVLGVVAVPELHVHSGPGPNYPTLGILGQGEEVRLLGRGGSAGWVRGLSLQQGFSGWMDAERLQVSGDLLDLPIEEVESPPSPQPTFTAAASPTAPPAPVSATPIPTTEPPPPELSWVVSDKIVTAMYRGPSGDIYFAEAASMAAISDPFAGQAAVWKKPPDGPPIRLTRSIYNLIGGIVVHNGRIYFTEAWTLRRMPDDNQMHDAQEVLRLAHLSDIYMHINHALAKHTIGGEDVLLMAVGSRIDSNYDAPLHHSGIQPPYYEDFPTGRILFAPLSWLETATNFVVDYEKPGQVSEFARGFRNPWSLTVAFIAGRTRVLAADNDPSFTPAKLDQVPQNAGDELTEVLQGRHHGHPYFYAGQEPQPDYVPPLTVFPDGSVPSGVAVAAGKVFVALQNHGMITKVDLASGSWTPVMTEIGPFNLYGDGDLLYVLDWSGIRVIDAAAL